MASRLGITMSRKAVSEDPFFPIGKAEVTEFQNFPNSLRKR
jgi:hypothetical protein